ncbi:MAG: uncharacterized protein QOE22_101 [Candidatus Parcubacteria bacterium]|jgi:uncharacterized membrane protein (UPF0127 family)|nr:uncharacterized protein [Candidatus Parcubacteria bacterium]
MTSKRHLVLYGIGAVVLLAVALVFLIVRKDDLSDIPEASDIATTSALVAPPAPAPAVPETKPAPKPFRFEVVTTQAAQAKGLGGRTEIPSDYGMLFVFKEKATQNFWMKDMLAPIDILWVRDDGVVAGVEREVDPKTYPSSFMSPEPVRYVLETRAGEASRLGISTGTRLNLPLPYGRTVSE